MQTERSLLDSFEVLRGDLAGFIETRYEILRTEMTASFKRLRGAAVLFAAAALFGFLGLLFLGFCVALALALVFGAFTNQVGLVWGFLVVGGGSMVLAGFLAMAGRVSLKSANLKPDRTLRVLRRDQEAIRGIQAIREGGQHDVESENARRRA